MQLHSSSSRRYPYLAAYFVLFVAVCFIVFLVSSNQPGLFFSGDGGMKFMVVKQLETGHGFKYLYLPQPAWVHTIWENGFFPFSSPFIYPSPQGDLFSFPPYFQVISAFFYHWMGYAGLYILPLVCTLLFWGVMLLLLRRAGIAGPVTALLLFLLVFCSPLTLYGAVYWEHMPAVLLLCAGMALVTSATPGIFEGLVLGLLTGLAVFLRPEALVINILYGIAALVLNRQHKSLAYWFFMAGQAAAVVGFLFFNRHAYGSFLGVHSYQVLQEQHGIFYKIAKGCKYLLVINWISIRYFPFLLLLLPVLYGIWKRKLSFDLRTSLLLMVLVGFCLLSPFMLPNDGGMQWGARYFLPAIPLFILIISMIIKQLGIVSWRSLPSWSLFLLLGLALYAFALNSIAGGMVKLRAANYQRVKPAMDFVQQQPDPVIVVGSGYIPMEMGSLFDKRYFFLAENDSAFNRLEGLLREQHVHQYLYINQEDSCPRLPNLLLNGGGSALIKKGNYYFARYDVR